VPLSAFNEPGRGEATAVPGESVGKEDAGSGNGGNGSIWSTGYWRTDESLDCLVWPFEIRSRAAICGLLVGNGSVAWLVGMVVFGDCDK
jgi:hypothetical protein